MDRHRVLKYNAAIEFAAMILANKDEYLIVDTETTGLKDDDLVISIGIMDLNRNMLIDTLVKPTSKPRINRQAQFIHGISLSDLKKAPRYPDLIKSIVDVTTGKTLLCFNLFFHFDKLSTTFHNEGCKGLNPFSIVSGIDIQDLYSGITSTAYPYLPGRDNTNIGDCNAVLDLIEDIAARTPLDVPDELPDAVLNKSENETMLVHNSIVLLLAISGAIMIFNGSAFVGILLLILGYVMKRLG